jgi:hypothetical protein
MMSLNKCVGAVAVVTATVANAHNFNVTSDGSSKIASGSGDCGPIANWQPCGPQAGGCAICAPQKEEPHPQLVCGILNETAGKSNNYQCQLPSHVCDCVVPGECDACPQPLPQGECRFDSDCDGVTIAGHMVCRRDSSESNGKCTSFNPPSVPSGVPAGNVTWSVDPVDLSQSNKITIDRSSVHMREGNPRVYSTQLYKNVRRVSAQLDLSQMDLPDVLSGGMNATLYFIGTKDNIGAQQGGYEYCDRGGNQPKWNCRELDLIETNASGILQTTLHLGGGIDQRYESTFVGSNMKNGNKCFLDPTSDLRDGEHNGKTLDMTSLITLDAQFNYDGVPYMTVTLEDQHNHKVQVYDSRTNGQEGSSANVDMSDLKATMEAGVYLVSSLWMGWYPNGRGSSPWFDNSDESCKANEATGGSYSLYNVYVDADI